METTTQAIIEARTLRDAVRAVSLAASRDDMFPTLCAVQVGISGGVLTLAATDRYRLHVVTVAGMDAPDVEPVLVRARDLLATVKAWKVPARSSFRSLVDFTPDGLGLRCWDSGAWVLPYVHGEFPKWATLVRDVERERDGITAWATNPAFLAEALDAAAIAAGKGAHVMVHLNDSPSRPVLVTGGRRDALHVSALVMPLRVSA